MHIHYKNMSMFSKYNTSTSFLDSICYIHLLCAEKCQCPKISLGRVKGLAERFETESIKNLKLFKKFETQNALKKKQKQPKIFKEKVLCECKHVSVLEKVKYYEKIINNK